jgi:hypothetical protein
MRRQRRVALLPSEATGQGSVCSEPQETMTAVFPRPLSVTDRSKRRGYWARSRGTSRYRCPPARSAWAIPKPRSELAVKTASNTSDAAQGKRWVWQCAIRLDEVERTRQPPVDGIPIGRRATNPAPSTVHAGQRDFDGPKPGRCDGPWRGAYRGRKRGRRMGRGVGQTLSRGKNKGGNFVAEGLYVAGVSEASPALPSPTGLIVAPGALCPAHQEHERQFAPTELREEALRGFAGRGL